MILHRGELVGMSKAIALLVSFAILSTLILTTSAWADDQSASMSWTGPVKVSSNADFSWSSGGFDVGGSGDAFVIWRPISEWTADNSFRIRSVIMASHYNHSIGWSSPLQLNQGFAGRDMDIAVDDQGNAIAIWIEDLSSEGKTIFADRYVNGSGWSGKVAISQQNSQFNDPNVEMDGNGNAWVVWESFDLYEDDQWLRQACYFAGPMDYGGSWGWRSPLNISSAIDTGYSGTVLRINPDGGAIAGWTIIENKSVVIVNRYIPEIGWLGEERVSDGKTNSSLGQIAISEDGMGVCAWQEYDKEQNSVVVSTLSGSGWSPPFNIVNHSTSANEFGSIEGIGFLANDDVMLLVDGSYNYSRSDLTDFRIDASSGRVSSQEKVWDNYTRAASITPGKAIFIGIEDESGLSSREWTASTGWGEPRRYLQIGPESIMDLRIGIDSAGNAVAINAVFGPRVYDLTSCVYSGESATLASDLPVDLIAGVVLVMAVIIVVAIWYLKKPRP